MAKSDGSTASYYELPPKAKELQDLIAYKNMNAQVGEMFRGLYRYGEVDHSDKMREINKILFYAQAEKDRLIKYEMPWEKEVPVRVAKEPAASEDVSKEPMTEEEKELTQRLPICSKCNREISGRVYYCGNEPRCKQHAS